MKVNFRFSAAEISFHSGVSVWLFCLLFLGIAGGLLAWLVPTPQPDLPQLQSQFVEWARPAITPEPGERRLYIFLTLLSPLVLLSAWIVIGRIFQTDATAPSNRSVSSAWMTGIFLVIVSNGIAAYLIFETAALPIHQFLVSAGGLSRILGLAFILWLILLWRCRCAKKGSTIRKIWRIFALGLALLCALHTAMSLRVFDEHTAELPDPSHLNTALAGITQAGDGQRTLIDFLPQYGCYGEMLKPWFAVIGSSLLHMTLTMALLQFIALASITVVLSRILRSRILLLLTLGSFAWLMTPWYQTVLPSFDPYFQYFPIRLLCPALSILGVIWYLRNPSLKKAVILGLGGGFALWWNLDSGAVALTAFFGLLFFKAASERKRFSSPGKIRTWSHLAASALAALLSASAFYFYLCLLGKRWINLGEVVHSQQQFYLSGFYMIPMPMGLSAWHVVIAIYLLGLAHGLKNVWTAQPLGYRRGAVLHLSLLGIGLFSYYQGRSHDYCLLLCAWPAVMIAMILSDQLLTAARYRQLPRLYTIAIFPSLLLSVACLFCLWHAREKTGELNSQRWRSIRHQTPTLLSDGIEYARRSVPSGETVAFISPFQSIYGASTSFPAGIRGQSLYECLMEKERIHILDQIRIKRSQHIFTEFTYLPESSQHPLDPGFSEMLSDAYQVTGRNPKGNLLHWEPRPGPPEKGAFAKDFASRSRLTSSPAAPRHAIRFADPNVLLEQSRGECIAFPYEWGLPDFQDHFAIEILCTPAANQPGDACLLSNHPGSGAQGLTFQRVPGGKSDEFAFFFGNGRNYTVSAPLKLNQGKENYIVASCASGVVSIYLDGQLQQKLSLEGPIPASLNKLTVGDWTMGTRPFQGDIAEVKIHSQPLTAKMIQANETTLTGLPFAPKNSSR